MFQTTNQIIIDDYAMVWPLLPSWCPDKPPGLVKGSPQHLQLLTREIRPRLGTPGELIFSPLDWRENRSLKALKRVTSEIQNRI